MPCPHHDIKIVQRSNRQSAVAAAAYQSGERLFSGFVHCPHGQQNVGVGIPVPLVVNGKIGNHAFGNREMASQEPEGL